jgi:hypothetical protein
MSVTSLLNMPDKWLKRKRFASLEVLEACQFQIYPTVLVFFLDVSPKF